jgi:hypothetical protein
MLRKILAITVLTALLIVTTDSSGFGAEHLAPDAPWWSKVDPWVLDRAATEQTEFLVLLAEQADLSAAASLPTKLEKGRYVYETLTGLAARTQAPVLCSISCSAASRINPSGLQT